MGRKGVKGSERKSRVAEYVSCADAGCGPWSREVERSRGREVAVTQVSTYCVLEKVAGSRFVA